MGKHTVIEWLTKIDEVPQKCVRRTSRISHGLKNKWSDNHVTFYSAQKRPAWYICNKVWRNEDALECKWVGKPNQPGHTIIIIV